MATKEISKSKSIFIYSLSQGLKMCASFITLPIFTRYIPPEDYGIIEIYKVVLIIGIGLGNWGLINAQNRFFFI